MLNMDHAAKRKIANGSEPSAKRVKDNGLVTGKRTTLEELLMLPLKKRLEVFDALPEEVKITILYPQQATRGLPARSPLPPGWEESVRKAHVTVTGKIGERNVILSSIEDEDSDDDDSDVEGEGLYEDQVVRQMTGGSATKTVAEVNQHMFLAMVQRTLPITGYGFHVEDKANKDAKFCFCPCARGGVAARGQALCGMTSLLQGNVCNRKGPSFPKKGTSFIAHVKNKSDSCEYHKVLDDFLRALYDDYDAGQCGKARSGH